MGNIAKLVRNDLQSQYKNIKVLYVEDDRFSREKLLRILHRRFENIYVAIDGEEGYKLYQQHLPNLIIADIKMNQMSGLEMIGKIREKDHKVQIIVTTAHDENDFFIESIENNVNHYILKPIDLNRFLLAIQKSVREIQLENQFTKQKKLTRAILDFQDNLIFVIEKEEIVECNQAFSTFTGIDRNHSLHTSKNLSWIFVEEPNYFYPKKSEDWVKELIMNEKSCAKVKMINKNGDTAIYFMKAAPIPEENQILFVCTDITDLEEEGKKNAHLAMMDPLTKSYNRLKFDEILTNEMRRSERYNHSFSVIMMDIDFFKNVNDQFGHQVGDEVLITMSTIVQQRIRECDIFARWGGEEFVLLTPETDGKGAVDLAEAIRLLIEGFHFPNNSRLTCSFGVSEFSVGKSKRDLISEADQALYKSKKSGKNCVTIYKNEQLEGEHRVI